MTAPLRTAAPTDWSRWRACPVCNAALGEPCTSLTGTLGDGTTAAVHTSSPHGGRKPRIGAS